MPTTPALTPVERIAGVLVAIEALGVAALAGWQIVALSVGDTVSVASALALIVLTVVAAVAVGSFAVAILRGHSWGRSGAIVVQLLLLAVALGALTGTYADGGVAIGLAAPALVVLVLLVLSVGAAARREPDARPH